DAHRALLARDDLDVIRRRLRARAEGIGGPVATAEQHHPLHRGQSSRSRIDRDVDRGRTRSIAALRAQYLRDERREGAGVRATSASRGMRATDARSGVERAYVDRDRVLVGLQ